MWEHNISGKVVKIGRKWLYILIDGKNAAYTDQLLINEYTNKLRVCDNFTLTVHTEIKRNNYTNSYDCVHIAVKPCQIAQESIEEATARWWKYIQNSYIQNGYIYERGIHELQKLGCQEHNKEIGYMRDAIWVRNIIAKTERIVAKEQAQQQARKKKILEEISRLMMELDNCDC